MPELPTIQTERLILRPFVRRDAARLAALAGAREIADTTARSASEWGVLEDVAHWSILREAWSGAESG